MTAIHSLATLRCRCGSDAIFSIRPGQDAVFALPRDLLGNVDKTQAPIVIEPPGADSCWCRACWIAKFGGSVP